jgi:hypothetical protein
MNNKFKIVAIQTLLVIMGLYITIFGIYSISVIHFFVNGIILTILGLTILTFAILSITTD